MPHGVGEVWQAALGVHPLAAPERIGVLDEGTEGVAPRIPLAPVVVGVLLGPLAIHEGEGFQGLRRDEVVAVRGDTLLPSRHRVCEDVLCEH